MLITYPAIKSEVQEDEIWDLTAIREIPSRSGMWGVCSVEELGVMQHARALSLSLTHTHTHRRNLMTSWMLNAAAQALFLWDMSERNCHTRPGDEPFKTDAGNKCLSEKKTDGRRGRRRENPAKITVGGGFASSRPALGPPGFLQTTTKSRACGKWS